MKSRSVSLSDSISGELCGAGGLGLSSLIVDEVDVRWLDVEVGVSHPVESVSAGKSESLSSSGGGSEIDTDSVSASMILYLLPTSISSSSSISLSSLS